MSWKVLVSAPYMLPVIEEYRAQLEAHHIELVVYPVHERMSEEELLPLIGDIDGIIAGDDAFTERVLRAGKRLKVISKWGTGIDSFDLEAAERLGIAVRNTPGAFNDPVADQVWGYMLAFARQIPWIAQEMHSGAWEKRPCISLTGCMLGVIGVGRVGKAVVQRARGFGMCLLGNDLVEMPSDFLAETGVTMVDQETLLRESDFVSLNCDLNPTSYHIMGAAEFALMKPSAYLINTARGPLVDELALIAALQQGQIAGAGLDVFEDEPLPVDSPLRKMDNVLLSPHNANSSPEHWRRVHESTIANLLEELYCREGLQGERV
ncbi:MAG: phosphoglycerate dehydrogenase [Chloroflexi bacterium]|jgi:D-3-phosphoglycerate dehydrogenase|nr:phosphoglycerate dehydrogenase [Chloroflexota bacterium]